MLLNLVDFHTLTRIVNQEISPAKNLRDEPNCGLNDLLQRELADSRGRVVLVSQVFGYGDRHGARLRGYTTIDDAFNPWLGK